MLASLLSVALLLGAPPAEAEPEYRFSLEALSPEVELGAFGTLRIVVEPRADKKLNLKSPLRMELDSEGLRLDKALLGAADAREEDKRVTFETRFEGTRQGPASFSVRAVFFICDERVCERRTETRTARVTVRPRSRPE